MTLWKGRRLRASSVLSLLVFTAGLLLSAGAARYVYLSIQRDAIAEFERMAVRTEAEIAQRFEKVVFALRGAGGLYAASHSVERAEFRAYVATRNMEQEFPGVRGFGFIARVERDALDAFVAAERADDAPDFAVRQLVDKNHADLFVIKLIEPVANNKGAQGLDVGSEKLRRAGIQQAINTGATTVTGAITLVQDNKKLPGLLLYQPIYRPGVTADTPAQRRAALAGVLYAPIVMAEILDGIPDVRSGRLDFEIYDGSINSDGGALMFDADGHTAQLQPGQDTTAGRRFQLRRPLDLPGRSVTLAINSTPAFDASVNTQPAWFLFASGALVSALLGALLFQQASGRRNAETLARGMTADLQAALRDNEALLTTLNLHAIVSIADGNGDITEVNDAFCKISGYAREELIGQNHRIVNSDLHDADFWKEMWNVIASGFPWRGQVCNKTKDGSLYWVDTFIAPFIGNDGKIEKYISIRTDITESKANEQALREATEQAQAASLSKSQFLANMSHEIRTPMNAILGMLTLLRKTELTARQADYAAKSDGAARALLGLLNEILDFSKIEAGKMALDPHPFALDQLLRDLSVILSANVGDKPVEVLFDIDPEVPRQLIGDAMRLQQVLINLGGNAIKFTAQGEVILGVKVLRRTDDAVTLQWSMQDSGIGIAPENQARIFSGFTQAESSTTRRFGGTGLGVAISQRFVALMGGELELQSELGKGSRFFFTITLPVVESGEQSVSTSGHALRTLVVDDNPFAREVMAHMAQSLGWEVDLADSGEHALELLERRATESVSYQAIFVDWQMPGLDGWQTSQRIRELQARGHWADAGGKAPVVVMVTANGREMLSQRTPGEQAMLDGFLVKPVTASMLLDAMTDARETAQGTLPPSMKMGAVGASRLRGMRLLLVEDNLNNQQVARELLEDEGAQVQLANHGREAVEALAAAPTAFDVVLMDLQMPVMDGFAATKAIRRDLGLLQLPIVAMTANAMASDRQACLDAGMNDHVGKPFDLQNLVQVLRRRAGWAESGPELVQTNTSLNDAVLVAAHAAQVDLSAALQRLGGKQDVYKRMLATFVKDLLAMPAQLQTHAAQAQVLEAKRLLHTLKGLAATLGAQALSTQAALAEKSLLAAQDAALALPAIAAQATEAILQAAPSLEQLLDALANTLDQTTPPGSGAPVDSAAWRAALQNLVMLLERSDMEAMNAMAELEQSFPDTTGAEWEALQAAMADMDFERALGHGRLLLQT